MLEKDFELSICVPIWYGATISEFEKCLDSIYTSIEKANIANNQKIKIIIGIDNIPKNYIQTFKNKNNIEEIKSRIDIFKNALADLKNGNHIKFEYFITEFNARVSVMRNIMISKSINSKYITFIDADDEITENAVSIMLNNISTAYKKNIKAIYFKIFLKEISINRFESIGVWGNLYDTSFLLEHNIAFIPGIPMEDRFFRREIELYAIEEEQKNVYEITYLHNKEAGSGFLESHSKEIARQESFKRTYYLKLKIKTYSSIKRGLDEVFYKEINHFIDFESISDKYVDEYMFNVFNKDKHILKEDLENYKFADGKKLFSYNIPNHFTLCNIINNNEEKEVFCKGYITNGSIKINNIENFNKIIESLKLDSIKLIKLLPYFLKNKIKDTTENILEKLENNRNNEIILSIKDKNYNNLLNILAFDDDIDLKIIDKNILDKKSLEIIENYAFNQAYIAIMKEDIEKLNFLLSKFPNIINLKNQYNINLANISSRKQTIEDNLMDTIKSKVIEDKNRIIAILLSKSPESFKINDIYGKNALSFILREYIFNLTTNNNILDEKIINDFLDITKKLIEIFKDNSHKLVQLFRYIYYELDNKDNKKILDILLDVKNGKILDLDRQKELLDELYSTRERYNSDILINENINIALEKKDYKRIKDLLMIREESLHKKLGAQKGQNKPEIIYVIFSTIDTILNYRDKHNKTILDYTIEDGELKNIIKEFLEETVWLNLVNKDIETEPMNLKTISRIKTALKILFDKKYNFGKIELSFNDFLNKYFEKSNILKSAKTVIEFSNSIKNIKNNLNKNAIKKIEKLNNNGKEKIKEMKELLNNIELLRLKQDSDINKINELLNIFENFAKDKKTLK